MNTEHQNALAPFVDRLIARSVLTATEQEAILALPSQHVEVRARHDFVRLREEVTHSCFIASGLVARFGQSRDGLRQITAFHVPGDMADLHSAIRPIGLGGLTALCDTVLLKISHSDIRTLASQYPAVAEAFWRDCMLDAAILMEWITNIGRHDARARLAHILCEMALRYGRGCAAASYPFPVTQEQLGDAASLTSVHVNRSLRGLREEGLADVRKGKVEIMDWEGLVRAGEFDPTYLVADTAEGRQKRLLAAV